MIAQTEVKLCDVTAVQHVKSQLVNLADTLVYLIDPYYGLLAELRRLRVLNAAVIHKVRSQKSTCEMMHAILQTVIKKDKSKELLGGLLHSDQTHVVNFILGGYYCRWNCASSLFCSDYRRIGPTHRNDLHYY